MGNAIKQNDYDRALAESWKLTKNPKRRIAAQALYNCAVLSERKNDIPAARQYVQESIEAMPLSEALAMCRQLDNFLDRNS